MTLSNSDEAVRLRTRDLAVGYVREVVLRVPDLALHRGQTVLIRGENGSGKTTFLKTVAGLVRPVSGSFDWAPPAIGSSIAHLPQNKSLFPSLSVGQNLTAIAGNSAAAHRRVEEVLGCSIPLSRTARSLSGGEARLTALVGLLCGKAPILLLDEPFAALAEGLLPGMIGWMDEEARSKGRLICVVEHRILPDAHWRTLTIRDGVLEG